MEALVGRVDTLEIAWWLCLCKIFVPQTLNPKPMMVVSMFFSLPRSKKI